MVSIHAAVGISTSLLFYKKVNAAPYKVKSYVFPFFSNVVLHGVMDIIPHSHLIPSIPDMLIALLIPALLIPFIKRKYLILVLTCYLGSIFPDLIDLGVFRLLGLGTFRIFPWHLVEVYFFLDAIYTNHFVNVLFDIMAATACFALVFWKRKGLQLMLRTKQEYSG